MKRYRIKEGDHDWSPIEFLKVWNPRRRKTLSIRMAFDSSCLYDWRPDNDQLDWNKVGGMSFDFFRNTQNAIIAAWRPNPVTRQIELTAYRHKDGGTFKGTHANEVMLSVDPGDSVTFHVQTSSRGSYFVMWFSFGGNQKTELVSLQFHDKKWFARRIGMWFGGANNSPGPHGGTAPHEMEAWIDFQVSR
jgi:hypothetical protein